MSCPRGPRSLAFPHPGGPDGTVRARCFGTCGLRGDVFSLLAAVHQLALPGDFPRALELAEELVGGAVLPELAEQLGDDAEELLQRSGLTRECHARHGPLSEGASVERVLPPRGAKDWCAALEARLGRRRR